MDYIVDRPIALEQEGWKLQHEQITNADQKIDLRHPWDAFIVTHRCVHIRTITCGRKLLDDCHSRTENAVDCSEV